MSAYCTFKIAWFNTSQCFTIGIKIVREIKWIPWLRKDPSVSTVEFNFSCCSGSVLPFLKLNLRKTNCLFSFLLFEIRNSQINVKTHATKYLWNYSVFVNRIFSSQIFLTDFISNYYLKHQVCIINFFKGNVVVININCFLQFAQYNVFHNCWKSFLMYSIQFLHLSILRFTFWTNSKIAYKNFSRFSKVQSVYLSRK